MDTPHIDDETNDGVSRRSMIKRGAMLGGALVWATPVVQSIALPAHATGGEGSPACTFYLVRKNRSGAVIHAYKCRGTAECCDCLGRMTAARCFSNGSMPCKNAVCSKVDSSSVPHGALVKVKP